MAGPTHGHLAAGPQSPWQGNTEETKPLSKPRTIKISKAVLRAIK